MGWLDDLQNSNVVRGLVHNARQWENDLDSDHDGSVLDQVGRSMQEHVPVVGPFVGQPLEDLGDCATDIMGTRDQGVFSHAGTLDTAATTDTDYSVDGEYDHGVGQAINNSLGLNIDPAVPAAMAVGSLTGGAGSLAVLQNEVLTSATRAMGGRIPEVPSLTSGAADWIRNVDDLEGEDL